MFILNGLSRADGEKLSGELAKVKSEADALRTETDALNENKLEQKLVDDLLSSSKAYDFDDRKPLFSVPAINGAEKGTSSVVEDENGCYQAVEVGTGTIGSTSNVYSQFKLGSITENASKITLEFDFEYEHNGRMKLAIADLDVINSLSNSDIRWNTKGIAADIFSNSNNNFQINGKDALRASFFGTWLHAKFVMDFSEKKVQYTITSKTNPADTLEGNVDFRDTDCAKITGIAVYTWLQNDKLYIDNINITALYDARENTRYIVGTGGVYKEYTYIDGVPVLVGRSDAIAAENGAITEPLIANRAVTEGKIAMKAVGTDELADKSVVTRVIADKAVTGYQLAEGAVNYGHMANDAVINSKIANDAVTTSKIIDGAVNDHKLADGAVTMSKLAADVLARFNYTTTPQQIGTWIDGKPIYREVCQGVFEDVDIGDILTDGGMDGSGVSFTGNADITNMTVILSLKTIYHINAGSPDVVDDIVAVGSGCYGNVIALTYTSAELAAKLTAGVSGYTTIVEYVGKE